jgi:hypothetical protein
MAKICADHLGREVDDPRSILLRIFAEIKMGRQPRSGDSSLAIGPFDPDWDRR